MDGRTPVSSKALSLLVVWTMVAAALLGLISLIPPARAGVCDQVGVVVGDWTISNAQTCEGILFSVDGSVTIAGTGSLTLINGGLKFLQDTSHIYNLTVAAGGKLILDNSIVTTEPRSLDAYLKLDMNVDGNLTMMRGSVLKFPGTLDVTGGASAATLWARDATITGHATADVTNWTGPVAVDDNDDAPTITFTNAWVVMYDSRIERLYENATQIAPSAKMITTMAGNTTWWAINTYIGVDFDSDLETKHNYVSAAGTSRAFFYNVTLDQVQSDAVPPFLWSRAFVASAGGTFYLHRWLDAQVADENGVPVPGATIWSRLSPTDVTAEYPDNGNLNTPGPTILAYLRKTAANFNTTESDGRALIPLYTESITSSSMPDGSFVGNYEVVATFVAPPTYTATGGVSFDHYPIVTESSNWQTLYLALTGLSLPRPDLIATVATFIPATPLEGDTVQVSVTVSNQGAGGSGGFAVNFYDNYQGSAIFLLQRAVAPLGSGSQVVLAFNWVNVTQGQHSIRVDVDALFQVVESVESNNIRFFPISVTPIGPDLAVGISFDPDPGFAGNTVQLLATVVNNGGKNATNFLLWFKLGSLTNDPYAVVTIDNLENSTIVSVPWIPPAPGSYTWYVVVDPDNRIPELPPYSEDDNVGSNTLVIIPAPNLQILKADLTTSDPFPKVGDSVNLGAVVRNTGEAASGPFRIDFYMDDGSIGSANVSGLGVGQSAQMSTVETWTAPSCGYHTLRGVIDPLNVVAEGSLYELDNTVTTSVQVYPANVIQWSFSATLTTTISVASNLEITGDIVLDGGGIYVSQREEVCNRAFIKILGGGSLTLKGASLSSNWPLVVYTSDTAQLVIETGSTLGLNSVHGPGTLRSDRASTLWIEDTVVVADVQAFGASSHFQRVDFAGSSLYVNTTGRSDLWDVTFSSVTTLGLLSDDGNVSTVDFDARNTTFSQSLTSQLRFTGSQYVQLTNVTTFVPSGQDWWAGMINGGAKVSRFWWLRIDAIDGTDTLLEGANVNITFERLNAVTLGYEAITDTTSRDVYGTDEAVPTWPIRAPGGWLLYRARTEDRFASPTEQWVNSTYRADGTALVEMQVYSPNASASVSSAYVTTNTALRLVFTDLTPDLYVVSLQFVGQEPGQEQPLNRPVDIVATIGNFGNITTRNVRVDFFEIDVDTDGDGRLDSPVSAYIAAGVYIGQTVVPSIPQRGSAPAAFTWIPSGLTESIRSVSVYIDPPTDVTLIDDGFVREVDETNNHASTTATLFPWPDLSVASVLIPTAVENNAVTITVRVQNVGTSGAASAYVALFADGAIVPNATSGAVTVARGATVDFTVPWTPGSTGVHTVSVRALSANDTIRNTDYNWANNVVDSTPIVVGRPDLAALLPQNPGPFEVTQGQASGLIVRVTNLGGSAAQNVSIEIYFEGDLALVVGRQTGVSVPVAPAITDVTVPISAIGQAGNYQITILVDADGAYTESNEVNNWLNVTLSVAAPEGSIFINTPAAGSVLRPGTTTSVSGVVRDSAFTGIAGVQLQVSLLDSGGTAVAQTTTTSGTSGLFQVNMDIPATLADGAYSVEVRPSDLVSPIPATTNGVSIQTELPWWQQPFVGLPLWIWLIIVAAVVAVLVGVSVYFRVFGLGKLVECGECGAFIPQDATKCPKCGVEFEKDMAKCSNCQAWIPVDVKQCPECGVEFATGEVEMADYEQKMRMQYDDVVRKFREKASAALGHAVSDEEFQEWWRKQPTFVTFDDWLREEEEMRRMGSRPCPVCTTLNSVTATVCHKCGTYLKDEPGARPPRVPPPREVRVEETPSPREAPPEDVPEAASRETLLKRVAKKPIGPPVVQKKVIRRPKAEGEEEATEGEGTE